MIATLVFALGLCLGSFANVCIYRLPRHESIARPRSHCTNCGRTLAPGDLVPVVSFALLRGRCRYCGAPIAPRYPLVELLAGGLFLAAYVLLGLTSGLVAAWVTIFVGIVAFFTDIDSRIIPNALTVPAIIAGLALAAATGRLASSLLGLAVCGGGFLIIGLIGAGKLGGGDIKLAAAIGAILGLKAGAAAVLAGVIAGALIGIALIAFRRATLKSYIPFAPPLTVAAVVVALTWPQLEPALRAYLGW
ncbi:MAG: prepilin peptidase [Chloroflexota bacterium]